MTPNAGAKLLPMSELTETAIATLCREIGPVNTARFINHFSTGLGDYHRRTNPVAGQAVH